MKSKTLSQNHSLSYKSSIIAFSKAISVLLSLVISMMLARYLSVVSYGYYKEIQLVYNTLVPILTIGIPTSINYFVPRSSTREEAKNYVYQSYLILLISGIILTLFMYFGANFLSISIFHSIHLIPLFKVFSPIPVLTMPTLFYINLLICEEKSVLAAKLSLTFALIRFMFILFVLLIFHAGLFLIIVSLLLYSIIQFTIVTFIYVKLYGKIKLNLNIPTLKSQLSYAIPIAATSIVGILTAQTDKLMISYFFTPAQYAIYANGAIEVPFIGVITGSVNAVILPEFVKKWKMRKIDEMLKLWWSAMRKVGIILIPLMFFLLVYSKEALTILFSSKYTASASIFSIYLLKLPMRITVFGSMLLAMGLPNIILRYALYTLILNIILNVLFIKFVGFKGPAIATVIATYFINFVQLLKISKVVNKSIFKIFPYSKLSTITLVSLVLIIPLALLKPYLNEISLLFSISMSFVLYYGILFASLLKFGIISKKDLAFLKSFYIWRR